MRLKVVLHEGDEAPSPWYGRAYACLNSRDIVCYPMPLHWVVGWWRNLCWTWRQGLASREEAVWNQGYEAGMAAERRRHDALIDCSKTIEMRERWGIRVQRIDDIIAAYQQRITR